MTDESRFVGQTAVITGAASGIGTGLAREVIRLGMNVVLADINAAQLEQFAATLSGRCLTVPTDVSDSDAVERLATRAFESFDSVDLVFNNAAIAAFGFTWEIAPSRFEREMAVNVLGVFNGIRAFIPRMLAAGKGRLINTTSAGGFIPVPMMSPYITSKFALVGLTESLYFELQMLNAPVQVSLLIPELVKSGALQNSETLRKSSAEQSYRPEVQQFVDSIRRNQEENGASPEEFAKGVFQGIARGDYWLAPQGLYLNQLYRERTELMLQRKPPRSVS